MTESKARLVDALCKIAATLALVVGGGWTLYTYFKARATEIRNAGIEARKPFLAKRLEIYAEFVDLAARTGYMIEQEHSGSEIMINTVNPQAKENLRKQLQEVEIQTAELVRKFDDLNRGRLAMVEDKKVEYAVNNFVSCVDRNECVDSIKLAQAIAHACRDSIGSEWEVDVSNSPVTIQNLEKLRH